VNLKSFQFLFAKTSLLMAGSLTLAGVATVSHTEQAQAVALNLSFANPTEVNNIIDSRFGTGTNAYSGQVIHFTNVATDASGTNIDATITATASGNGYSFVEHIPKYNANGAASSSTETAFLYQIDGSSTGKGGLTYKIDFFNHATNAAYTLSDIRLNVYDVDGETSQSEAFRIAKGTGLVGYQIGKTASAVGVTEDATSYLFSGKGTNVLEGTPTNGAGILYYQNVNSVTIDFEANTKTSNGSPNGVYSGIDGDLSLISQAQINSNFGAVVNTSSTSVPEPFTIIGSIVGGTAAFRMRKKLKSTNKA
jgi:hypothetical protein